MKKIFLTILIPFVFWCGCTEKTYNYYMEVERGALAGVVEPAESGARVSAWQGKEVSFTFIDSTGYFILLDLPVGTYTIKVEAGGYTTYESAIFTVYKGGVTTIGRITLHPFPDLIGSVYPPDKAANLPLYTNIRIYFKKPMNKESVEDAFSIDPPTEGTLSWSDYNRYSFGRYLEFSPASNLLPKLCYTVTLDIAAQDTAGNHLTEPFSFYFTTAGVVVESYSPPDNQSDVETGISIYMNFNTVMNQETVENAFSIDPPTVGEFEWRTVTVKGSGRSQDRLRFKPEGYFKTRTYYTVELDTTAKDTNGIALYEPVRFSFTTEELKIRWTYPEDGWTDVSTGISVAIYFNSLMSEAITEQAFSINPEICGSFDWFGAQLRFSPEKVLGSDMLYTITIDTSAQSMEGVRLNENYSFSFTTSEIQITSSSPDNGANYVSPETNVQITFNTDMDQLSVVNAFSMIDVNSAEISGEFSWSDLNKLTFDPDLVLALNKEYTVIIGTDALDIRGVNMPEEFVLWFKTRP
jgi:hypothetical protein